MIIIIHFIIKFYNKFNYKYLNCRIDLNDKLVRSRGGIDRSDKKI